MGLLSNVFLCSDAVDERIWKPDPSGSFSSKSFYRKMDPFSEVRSSSTLIWMGRAPPRVEAFCWLVVTGKTSTVDNLRRRGLTTDTISDKCSLGGREIESIDHLFIHCNVASAVWGHFLKECGVVWCLPGSLLELILGMEGVPLNGYRLLLWRSNPFSVL